MSFFAELIESFIPTLAFAEEPAEEVEEQAAPVEESTPVGEASVPSEQEEAPVEEEAAPAAEEEDAPAAEDATEEAAEEEAAPAEEEEAAEEAGEEEEEEEEEDEDDEDEEEEGSGDPLEKLRKDCADTPSIRPYLHHYEHCIERVTKAQEEPGYEELAYKEDCVEEFFHLQHHLNDCVAPRLFARLK